MIGSYILDAENNPVPCEDTLTWAAWFEESKRIVARTEIGDLLVSTVFLGIDHRFHEEGPPILWETMVFGGSPRKDLGQWRYASHAAALKGHEEAVKKWRRETRSHG